MSENNVVYSKTQIRISNFAPYNGARATKDYERACINKGSVIALKNLSAEQIAALKNGVGAYLSEGFGEVLINPWFLNGGDEKDRPIRFQAEVETQCSVEKMPIQSDLAKFLQQKETAKKQALEIAGEVAKFIKANKSKFDEVSNSQWGAIRALCKADDKGDVCARIKSFISNGVASKYWDYDSVKGKFKKDGSGEALLKAIKNSNQPLKFALLLSMQIPRIRGGKQ